MEKKTVLVFDAAQRSALAVTRSLGKRENITLYTTDAKEEALAGQSAFSEGYLVSPDPANNIPAFIEWLNKVITEKKIDFLLPVTEITSRTLLEYQSQLAPVSLPFAPLPTILALSDKNALTKMAGELGIPVPASGYYDNINDVNADDIRFPCVLKPALSKVKVDDQWLTTQVHIVQNAREFEEIRRTAPYFTHPFMVQQYIDGHGAGLFCYYQKGVAKAFFAHKRLREKPPSGGVSVLSESAHVDERMKGYAEKLMDSVNWHGAAMIEFKVASDGTPYLMEVNTRLWGSLQLAIDAGVDFPGLLFDGEYGALPEQSGFKKGVQLRWLLGDVDNLYINLRDAKSFGEKLSYITAFLTPKWHNRRHEINRLGDMKPFWFELKNYLK